MYALKPFFSFFLLASLGTIASAAPFVVYSGEAVNTNFNSAEETKSATWLYLIADVAHPSQFAILQVDPATKTYSIISRPSASPTSEETNNNFFSGIAAVSTSRGQAVLSFGNNSTDSSNNTYVTHAYATGVPIGQKLTLQGSELVAASGAKVINLKSNGVSTGTYTFNAHPAIYADYEVPGAPASGDTSAGGSLDSFELPKTLSGVVSSYEISPTGQLTNSTVSGTLVLTENPTLTALVDAGGGYTSGKNTVAFLPLYVNPPFLEVVTTTTPANSYSAWLSAFAQVNGFTPTSTRADPALPLSSGLSNTTLAFNGTLYGATTITFSSGTLKLAVGSAIGCVTQVNLGIGFGSALAMGTNTPIGGSLNDTSYSLTDPNSPNAILTFDLGSIGSGVSIDNGSNLLGNGQFLTMPAATISMTALNNNLLDGNISALNLTSFIYTGATLISDDVNVSSTYTPGRATEGNIVVTNGTLTDNNGVFANSGSTFNLSFPDPGAGGYTYTFPLIKHSQ